MAKKPAAKKAPAKAGKKPTRGVAKKAPVRVKAPKTRALRVPAGDVSQAVAIEAPPTASDILAARARVDAKIEQTFGVPREHLGTPREQLETLRRDAHARFRRQGEETLDRLHFEALMAPLPTRFQRFRAFVARLFGA